MLEQTLERTKPRAWRVAEEPTAADGVREAWIFETRGGRRRGHVRLLDGKASEEAVAAGMTTEKAYVDSLQDPGELQIRCKADPRA